MPDNTNNLVISLITQDRPGIVKELSETVNHNSCNIEDSRMMVLGGSFAILMMVSGKSNDLDTLQAEANKLADSLSAIIQMHIVTERTNLELAQSYLIEVVCLDNPGIVRELSEFVASRQINIESLNTETYAAPHTGSSMFRLEMTVTIPSTVSLAKFKDALVDHCDQQNLDVLIEPAAP